MKQSQLVKETYAACVNHDIQKQRALFQKELAKIIKRKQAGKPFTARWTVVR